MAKSGKISQKTKVLNKLMSQDEISVLDFPTGLRLSDRIFELRKTYDISMELREVSENSFIGFYKLIVEKPVLSDAEKLENKSKSDKEEMERLILLYPDHANNFMRQQNK